MPAAVGPAATRDGHAQPSPPPPFGGASGFDGCFNDNSSVCANNEFNLSNGMDFDLFNWPAAELDALLCECLVPNNNNNNDDSGGVAVAAAAGCPALEPLAGVSPGNSSFFSSLTDSPAESPEFYLPSAAEAAAAAVAEAEAELPLVDLTQLALPPLPPPALLAPLAVDPALLPPAEEPTKRVKRGRNTQGRKREDGALLTGSAKKRDRRAAYEEAAFEYVQLVWRQRPRLLNLTAAQRAQFWHEFVRDHRLAQSVRNYLVFYPDYENLLGPLLPPPNKK